MGFIHGANRHEESLFPERLDDSIAAEHPVRFRDAFVDHLNLTTLGWQRANPLPRDARPTPRRICGSSTCTAISTASDRGVAWNKSPTGTLSEWGC